MSLHFRNAEPTEAESVDDRAVPRAHEARLISAVLANGRSIRLRVPKPYATAADLGAVVESVNRSTERQSARNVQVRRTLKALAQAVGAQTARTGAAWKKTERKLAARIRNGDRANARASQKALALGAKVQTRTLQELDTALTRSHKRALWDALVIAGTLPLVSAYRRRGDPAHMHNLTLGSVAGIWLVGDELVDALSGDRARRAAKTLDTDLWSYTAPIGALATGWWLLRSRQHRRFLTGRSQSFVVSQGKVMSETAEAEFGVSVRRRADVSQDLQTDVYHSRVDLEDQLAPHFDLSRLSGVPAVATVASYRASADLARGCSPSLWVRAEVVGHELIIEVVATARCRDIEPGGRLLDALEVAWMVDAFAVATTAAQEDE